MPARKLKPKRTPIRNTINLNDPATAQRKRVADSLAERRKRTGSNLNASKPDLTDVSLLAGPGNIFLPDNLNLVRYAAMRGCGSDELLSEYFGISEKVLASWRERYPDFEQAIDEGYSMADAEVVVGMHKAATGFEYTEEQAVGGKSPSVMRVKRQALPNVVAQKAWLAFRRKDFREAQNTQRLEHTGANGGPIDVTQETKSQVIATILAMVQSKPDGK